MVVFQETHVVLQLNGNGLIGTKIVLLHLEKPMLMDVFFSETQFSQGKSLLDAHASNKDVFLSTDACVSFFFYNKNLYLGLVSTGKVYWSHRAICTNRIQQFIKTE
jgi:hypothetical protein